MDFRKQDLYLFFEENKSHWEVINARLVSLYMNRFVIEEENQNEIIGVYNLKKVPHRKPLDFDAEKKSYDDQLIENAYNDANSPKQQENMAHFIIGTKFLYKFWREPNEWIEEWLHSTFKEHFTQSNSTSHWPMVVTLLQGRKQVITSVDLVEDSYFPRKKRRRTESWTYPTSVNDDLETKTHKFKLVKDKSGYNHLAGDSTYESSIKIISNHKRLFFCPMLTDSEVKELERAWNRPIFIPSADRDPPQPYHFYECERLTMIVNPDQKHCMMIMP